MRFSFKEKFYEFIDDEYKLYYITPFIDEISVFLDNNKNYCNVLDFGCGFGELSNVFFQSGFDVVGLDSDLERINKAKAKYPEINFLDYSYKDSLPFDDNSFDIIFSSSVLQYIDHDSLFKECLRVLKRGGCVIFLENLKNNPITRAGRTYLKLRNYDYQSYPWNHLTLKEIQGMKRSFNLITVKYYHVFGPLFYMPRFKFLKPLLKKTDKFLINFNCIKQISWLALIIGKK
ncbi:class I SAM-dependent methyltransferase [Chryseobacterium bernardetii]|uniref:class I SAM-dependent methyltransferase n=1 Tax=Chryseobacterium bernardetii TaxID=1241978 RepID=UPI003019BCAF